MDDGQDTSSLVSYIRDWKMRLTQTEISANLFSFHILTPLSSVMLTLCSLTRDFTVSTQPFLAAMCRGVVVCWTENRGTMDEQ